MPQAFSTRADLTVFDIDSVQQYSFGAAYGGLSAAPSDVNVTFVLDTAAISAYNAANGTSFVVLPDSSYTISGLSSTIPSGQTSSTPLTLSIQAKKLSMKTSYMLPVTMKTISSGQLESSLATSYFRVDSLQFREKDITGKGQLAVSQENGGGADATEGSSHLVDSDFTTKFLTSPFTPGFWYQLQFPTAQVINAYTMTSGNDTPERDPTAWQFSGSNDGSNWVILDDEANQSFPNREQTVKYRLTNNTAYTYYRVTISANNGDGLWQQTEWRLLQYY